MPDPVHQALDELCQEVLGLRAQHFLTLIHPLDELRRLLAEDNLYIHRFAGLLRATNKSNPLDCKYVSKCLFELLEQPDNCSKLKQLILETHIGLTPDV